MSENTALLEALAEKWSPLIECDTEAKIVGQQKKISTAILLENTEQALKEAAPGAAIAGADIAGYDPVLVPMIRRAIPQLIAFDIVGVQPMTLPTGLVFARRARYENQQGREALFNEADPTYGNTRRFGPNGAWDPTTSSWDSATGSNFWGSNNPFTQTQPNTPFDNGRFWDESVQRPNEPYAKGFDEGRMNIGEVENAAAIAAGQEIIEGQRKPRSGAMGSTGIYSGVGANYLRVKSATAGKIVFEGNRADAMFFLNNTPIAAPGISDNATVQSASYTASNNEIELTINGTVDRSKVVAGSIVNVPLVAGRGYIASYGGEGQGNDMNTVTMSIEKIAVEAETHQLRTGYSIELAQDMRRLHNMDAEAELIDIMSKELVAEQNRIVLRDLYNVAKPAAQQCTTPGVWDYNLDSDGRWSNEKFKGLLFNIWRDANQIGVETRMGLGNFLIVSPNVASGLAAAGALDFAPAIQNMYNLQTNADFTQNTFAGVIDGKMKVYIDPYAQGDFYMVGYKGASAMEAGYFLCPYIPAQIMRATDPVTLQPLLGMKMRYGRTYNPLSGSNLWKRNCYYRIAAVTNLGQDGSFGFPVTLSGAGSTDIVPNP